MLKFILATTLLFSAFLHTQEFKYNLTVCAIFQNESPYLKEWIDYHLDQGVEHFYLYNNNSTDEYLSVIKPYRKAKIVSLINWSSDKHDWDNFCFGIQPQAYTHAMIAGRKYSKWMAVIDTDEFIIPVCEKTILEVLDKHFWYCSGVCINWQCYGTSHIWEFPEGKMLETLTWKMKTYSDRNRHCKTIVNPRHVSSFSHPHACNCIEGHWCVDTQFNPCGGFTNEVYIDKLRINHYWTRDEKYLNEKKIPRYLKWNSQNKVEELLKDANAMNDEYDPILSGIRD